MCKRGIVPRIVLGKISTNQNARKERKRSVYGYGVCDVALCKEGRCFNSFHSL